MSKVITKNDYRLFEQFGKKYIYIADTGSLFETESRTIEVLDMLAGKQASLEDGYNEWAGQARQEA